MEQRLIDANRLAKVVEGWKKPKAYSEADERQNAIVECILYNIRCAPTVKPKTIKTTQSSRDEKYIFNGECNLDELYDTREKYIFNGEYDHSEHKDYPFESMGS